MSPSQICETSLHIITCEVKGHSLGTKTILAGQVEKNALQNLIRYKPTFVERFFMFFFFCYLFILSTFNDIKMSRVPFFSTTMIMAKHSWPFLLVGGRSIKISILQQKTIKHIELEPCSNDRSNILECHEIVNYVSIESLKVL